MRSRSNLFQYETICDHWPSYLLLGLKDAHETRKKECTCSCKPVLSFARLSVRCARQDEGTSWKRFRELWAPPAAYSSVVALPQRRGEAASVGVLFEASDVAPPHYAWYSACASRLAGLAGSSPVCSNMVLSRICTETRVVPPL